MEKLEGSDEEVRGAMRCVGRLALLVGLGLLSAVALVVSATLSLPDLRIDGRYTCSSTLTTGIPEPGRAIGDLVWGGKERHRFWVSENLPDLIAGKRLPVLDPPSERWERIVDLRSSAGYRLDCRRLSLAGKREHWLFLEDYDHARNLSIWAVEHLESPTLLFECACDGPWGVTTPVIFEDPERPTIAIVSTVSKAGSYPPPDHTETGILAVRFDPEADTYLRISIPWPLRARIAAGLLTLADGASWPGATLLAFFVGFLLLIGLVLSLVAAPIVMAARSVWSLLITGRARGP